MRWYCTLAIVITVCCLGACTPRSDRPSSSAGVQPRIVTLAPNLTELVFAAGAGDTLVGVSAYSDFPPPARELPLVGDAFTLDQERLALLKPDILIAWQSGTPAHVIDRLRALGFRVEVLRTRRLADVAAALRRIGELTGHVSEADLAARQFETELQAIAAPYAGADPISVFYQVSARPLYTVNGEHYVSELIGLCGGTNVFGDLGDLAPAVDVEAVVDRDPEVILASTDEGREAFAVWSRWPALAANRYDNLFLMPADQIGRATPRLGAAALAVCRALEVARDHREKAAPHH